MALAWCAGGRIGRRLWATAFHIGATCAATSLRVRTTEATVRLTAAGPSPFRVTLQIARRRASPKESLVTPTVTASARQNVKGAGFGASCGSWPLGWLVGSAPSMLLCSSVRSLPWDYRQPSVQMAVFVDIRLHRSLRLGQGRLRSGAGGGAGREKEEGPEAQATQATRPVR